MSTIFLKDGENLDSALRRLKTKIDTEGTLEEVRRLRAYETPTQRVERKLRNRLRREKIARLNRQSNYPTAKKHGNGG